MIAPFFFHFSSQVIVKGDKKLTYVPSNRKTLWVKLLQFSSLLGLSVTFEILVAKMPNNNTLEG